MNKFIYLLIIIQVHWHWSPPQCNEILINSLSIRICSFTIMDCAYYWSMLQQQRIYISRKAQTGPVIRLVNQNDWQKLTNLFNTFVFIRKEYFRLHGLLFLYLLEKASTRTDNAIINPSAQMKEIISIGSWTLLNARINPSSSQPKNQESRITEQGRNISTLVQLAH